MHVSEKDINLYLENALPLKKRKKMRQHFSACSVCLKKLKDYQSLYDTINLMENNYPLEGMELNIIKKIKEQKSNYETTAAQARVFKPNLVYALILFAVAGLFFTPLTNIAGSMARNTTTFMLNEWLEWINKVKWQVVDIIVKICSENFAIWLFSLACGIILVGGGAYLFFSGKVVQKA